MRRLIPILALFGLYWPGLASWFYQDDFGWLRLRQEVHSARDLAPALFAPKAHGNMRPLGENAYWLGLSSLFGANALPFRICAFLTQIASLVLLGAIVERLSRSRWAAFWAQIVWIASTGLAPAMCWSSIYNQVLSGFFFLLALYCLLRGWNAAHWAAFVLGLGALEINVVYPALAAVYALAYDRRLLRRIAPMFAVSALYVWVHFHFAGAQPGVYAMHFDARVFATFATYWGWALGRGPMVAALALSAAVLALVVWRVGKRDYLPLFGVAWFAITLAPYLPLPEHRMDYYLAVPAIGIAMVGAAAVARVPRAVAAAGIAAYLAMSAPAAWTATWWNHERSQKVADLVLGVAEIRRHDPGKIVLLDGIDTDLFWSGIADVPFLALEIPYVYLVPGAEGKIQAPADLVTKFELPEGMALDAVKDGRAVVYRMDAGMLRNATARYRNRADSLWKPGPPRFVNLGDPVFASYLGAGWDAASNGYRGMRHTASLRMGGGNILYIGVFRPHDVRLGLRVNGAEVPVELVRRDNELSLFRAALSGTGEWIDVTLSADSAVFGYVEVL
ncbi:MAG TPA: hypothetical protein VGS58_14100 [Candidatus Sulfopaludibacter sp.]|nr:hypothetical protein [Candidatus Sulfopaludibacter sp.]